MFKPCEIYTSKKIKKLTDDEDEEKALRQLKEEYFKLSDKKMLKFVKKAESKYDSYVQEHSDEKLPPFTNYLGKREISLLLKSYGMPEKPAANSRQAFVNKFKSEATDLSEKDLFQTAIERYKQLSDEEKNVYMNEYHKSLDDFNEKFFWFARNLPSERVDDYKNFLSKKSNTETDESETAAKRHTNGRASHSNQTSQAAKEAKEAKEERKEFLKNFHPLTHFLKKYPQSEATDESLKELNAFMYSSKMRTKYAGLSDKKKIKFIKEAEAQYDAFKDWNELGEPKQPFHKFLVKKEIKLLLESYGMPESIPLTNPSAYYFKIHSKEGDRDMKSIFESYKNIPEDEKKKFVDDYYKAVEEYVARNQSFLKQLPLTRVEDYNAYKTKKPKMDKPSSSKKNKSASSITVVKSTNSRESVVGGQDEATTMSSDDDNSGDEEETEEEACMKLKRKLIEENSKVLKSKKIK